MRKAHVQAELETIRTAHAGLLKPEDVVEFAKDPATALHEEFTWDDTEAAAKYRLDQARQVIRLIVTVVGEPPVPMRAYVSLPSDQVNKGGYRSIQDVVNDESRRTEMVRDALEKLQAMRRRYVQLSELQPVWAAMDKAQEELQAPTEKAAAG